ncbi:MAG: tRNA (guanosine(37)-N1)-methyltransferase TrmD [Planctomycetota bacterium]
MHIDVLTLFPDALEPFFASSIIGRAQDNNLAEVHCTDIRDFAKDQYRSVDDRPYGGGPGMVLMCQPLFDAVQCVESEHSRPGPRILLTPQGEKFTQTTARELAGLEHFTVICGHYEGFDERILMGLSPREISLGDYILSGGEAAAMVLIDAVVRLIPGALGDEESLKDESFSHGLLEYPQYTRPRVFKGMEVPEELLSGDHARIEQWRQAESLRRTRERRPDLLEE